MKFRALSILLLSTTAAQAEVPNVVTDIPAVHSLVSQVMDGVGEPSLLMKQGASPHGYSLRPSEARALQNANLVVWIGEDLTPWLENAIDSLAADAASLELLHAPGTEVLQFRETPVFAKDVHDDHDDHGHDDHAEDKHDDHDHGEEKHDDHDHDDHAEDKHHDHDHDEEKHDEHDHDDHAEDKHDDGHDDHGHDHDGADPHAWLDVHNAITWVGLVADSLSELDPENAATYAANAQAAANKLEVLETALETKMAPHADAEFVVFHDAYQYFEHATGIQATGALQLSDANPPSAAHLAEIQAEIQEHKATCIFSEPQFSDSLVKSVTNGQVASTELDPIGVSLELGKDFYGNLMLNLADSIDSCLK